MWRHKYPRLPLDLAVNVSTRQLLGPGLVTTVEAVLAITGMNPAELVLEMTEGMFINDADRALTVLADLKALGIQIALDDFGTGYCSLNYLQKFPVDIVKIDQSFIRSMSVDSTGTAIVGAITQLAHVLGLTVIAEGVETSQQQRGTTDIGCDAAQGYFYAKPMRAPDLLALLDTNADSALCLPTTEEATIRTRQAVAS
jgi:EAL domain-containing protein (putative c-di-GMP-specific phosphodiesterase class I)